VVVRIGKEEDALALVYADYAEYRGRSKRLFPFVF
jgi:protein-S-isoprenylcysteine O-methyltransferase Ste14